MKPSFRFDGLVGEIAIEVNVAVTLPVAVVFEDEVVVLVVVSISVVEEEFDDDVTIVVVEDPDEHADTARVKSVINPITRQNAGKRIVLIFKIFCPFILNAIYSRKSDVRCRAGFNGICHLTRY